MPPWDSNPPGAWTFVCCECRVLSGRGLCDELITRPEETYRLWCVVLCDLETSRIGASYVCVCVCVCVCVYIYIYDINSLRVNYLTLTLLTWRKWTPNNTSKWQMWFNLAFKGLIRLGRFEWNSVQCKRSPHNAVKSDCDFYESGLTESCTSLKLCSYFLYFSSDSGGKKNENTRCPQNMCRMMGEFRDKSVLWKPCVTWGCKWMSVRSVRIYCPISAKFCLSDLHIMLMRVREFR